MKLLLLGKDGQVGRALQQTLPALGELVSFGRDELNLEDLKALKTRLIDESPDIIVNAAAYTAVDQAEHDEERAYLINAEVVKILAAFAKANDVLLVHYSTDYVFDGEKTSPYIETDPVNPLSVYGASKRAGEQAILESGCRYLILRTSWVFSSTGKNFIKTILQLAKEKSSLKVVGDQFGAPTSADFIAAITRDAIAAFGEARLTTGIYHLTAEGRTNWYQLALYVVHQAQSLGLELKLNSSEIVPITAEEYPAAARRPKNSSLDCTALSIVLASPFSSWGTQVDAMLEKYLQAELVV